MVPPLQDSPGPGLKAWSVPVTVVRGTACVQTGNTNLRLLSYACVVSAGACPRSPESGSSQRWEQDTGCFPHPLTHFPQSRAPLFPLPSLDKYIPPQTGCLGDQPSKTEIKACGNRMLQKFHLVMFNNERIQLSETLVSLCN